MLSSRIYSRIVLLAVLCGLLWSVGFESVFAADPVEVSSSQTAVKVFNGIISLFAVLLAPLTALAGWLLTPDWVFGDFFGMRGGLHSMWIFMSNLVYIIFAIVTVGIAFMNILGQAKWGSYALKKALPRLVISILLVPVSWFVVEILVAVSSVLTAAIVQLPASIIQSSGNDELINFTVNKTYCIFNFENGLTPWSAATWSGSWKFFSCEKEKPGDPGYTGEKTLVEFFNNGTAFSVLTVYAYEVFEFQYIQDITEINIQTLITAVDLLGTTGLAIIFLFIFGLILIGIIAALFIRGIYLWIYAIASPIFALAYFFENKLPWFDQLKDFNFMGLVSLAMVPVYVGGALSFGLMFLLSVKTAGTNTAIAPSAQQWSDFFTYENHPWSIPCSTGLGKNNFPTSLQLEYEKSSLASGYGDCQIYNFSQGFSFMVMGAPVGINVQSSSNPSGSSNGFSEGFVGRFILKLFGLFILWIAVMAALKSSAITRGFVEPVIGALGTIAKITPIPGTKISLAGLKAQRDAVTAIPSQIESQQKTAASVAAAKTFGVQRFQEQAKVLGQVREARTSDQVSAAMDAYNTFIRANGRDSEVDEAFKSLLERHEDKGGLNQLRYGNRRGSYGDSKDELASLITKDQTGKAGVRAFEDAKHNGANYNVGTQNNTSTTNVRLDGVIIEGGKLKDPGTAYNLLSAQLEDAGRWTEKNKINEQLYKDELVRTYGLDKQNTSALDAIITALKDKGIKFDDTTPPPAA